MEKNVDLLNLTRNSRLSFCHLEKERINTYGYMSGDSGDKQKKPLVKGGQERRIPAKPKMSVSAALLHVKFRGT